MPRWLGIALRLAGTAAGFLWIARSIDIGDTLDSLVAACHAGLTVAQVPVGMRPRAHGNPSQGTAGSIVYLARAIFALLLAVMRRPVGRSPLEQESSA